MATIRARYENGILTPLEPLDLEEGREVEVYVPPTGAQQETPPNGAVPQSNPPQDDGNTLPEDFIDPFDTEEPPPGVNPTLWRIANIHKRFPPGTFDDLPTDMSINVDHYAYGLPKRTEETLDEE